MALPAREGEPGSFSGLEEEAWLEPGSRTIRRNLGMEGPGQKGEGTGGHPNLRGMVLPEDAAGRMALEEDGKGPILESGVAKTGVC